jgi:hypothetical protein
MLDDKFFKMIVQVTNQVVDTLTDFYGPAKKKNEAQKLHPTYQSKLSLAQWRSKMSMMLTHNFILQIMQTINEYGPNPDVPDTQYVHYATE